MVTKPNFYRFDIHWYPLTLRDYPGSGLFRMRSSQDHHGMISQLAGAGRGPWGPWGPWGPCGWRQWSKKPWLNQKPQETANFHGKSMGKIWENMGKWDLTWFDTIWNYWIWMETGGSFGDVKFNQTVLLKYDQFMSAKKYCLDSRQFVAFFAWLNLMLATCPRYFCYPTQ